MYDWGGRKQTENTAKHGVDFAEVEEFAWETAVIRSDLRRDYGEDRYFAFGTIGGRLHTLIFTSRGARANPRARYLNCAPIGAYWTGTDRQSAQGKPARGTRL